MTSLSPEARQQIEAPFMVMKDALRAALKNRRMVFMQNDGNFGDSLIRYGTLKFFEDLNLNYIEFDMQRRRNKLACLLLGAFDRIVNKYLFVYSGNGAWSISVNSAYKNVKRQRWMTKNLFLLPTTFEKYRVNFDFPVFVRDKFQSAEFLKDKPFCHDMAFYLSLIDPDRVLSNRQPPTRKIGLIIRQDNESAGCNMNKWPQNYDISKHGGHHDDPQIFLRYIDQYEHIVTDRLHVAIGAAILGKKVTLLTGSYFKIKAIYLSSLLNNFENIDFVETASPEFEKEISKLLSDNELPKVSIIMPAYNGIKTIGKALAALQAQTYPNIEIIVADDHSTDGTYEFVQELAKQDARIKVFQTPHNLGHGGASKTALQNSTGEWITMLDADDWCELDRIEKLVHPATLLMADMVIDNLQIFDHALGKIVKHTNYGSTNKPIPLTPEIIFKQDHPLRRDSIGYSKPMMRAAFLRQHDLNYWGKYRNNEDFILLAEILFNGGNAFILPDAYYVYRDQISPTARTPSPTSHSSRDTATQIAHASELLIEKYRPLISPQLYRQIQRRKNIFLTARIARKQKEFLLSRHYAKAVGLFMRHPFLLNYRALGARNRLYRLFHGFG